MCCRTPRPMTEEEKIQAAAQNGCIFNAILGVICLWLVLGVLAFTWKAGFEQGQREAINHKE